MKAASLAAIALVLIGCVHPAVEAAWCYRTTNETHPPNTHKPYTGDPVFVRSVPNGRLYTVGDDEDKIDLLHVYGANGYDYGYAAGQLLGTKVNETMTRAFHHFASQVAQHGAKKYNISGKMAMLIAEAGLEVALDWQNEESKPFIDPQVYAELHGLADGSGTDYLLLRRIHFFATITRAACSFFGAWGEATKGGKTLQLRALDWDTGAGLQDHPVVTIYHPVNGSGLGAPFANVGWAGWIGVLTGVNGNQIGFSEIGVSNPDSTFGKMSYIGQPFIFLAKQVMQHANSYKDAERMITNSNRTCDLILGIGDGKAGLARACQYSHEVANFFNDTYNPPIASWHPSLSQVVYDGMDWLCPWFQYHLFLQLQKLHGKLTPEETMANVTAVVGTGNLHIGVMDLTEEVLYVANAAGSGESGPGYAYQRKFVRLDLRKLFAKTQ